VSGLSSCRHFRQRRDQDVQDGEDNYENNNRIGPTQHFLNHTPVAVICTRVLAALWQTQRYGGLEAVIESSGEIGTAPGT